MSHTVIRLVRGHLLDKSVFELGYINTYIFKSFYPNRTRFSAVVTQSYGILLFGTPCMGRETL